jgi:acyl-CoA synthetase (NDP forming)
VVKEPTLEYLFHPKTIAVVGASSDPSNYFGYVYMAALSQFGENLYPVNPRRTEIHGLKAYPTLRDIPVPIDYVVCSIPAAQVPELIEESSAKGARVVQISSAGFSEAGDEQGARLEKELVETARRVGIRIIGPNCMGIYCPSAGLSYNSTFSKESGAVGYLSQSGGQTTYMVNHGTFRGIRFSKAISYGNACDLNESDFLDYFADDLETKVISSYIEGTTDGQRLLKALEKASRVKPVIVCKGGQTDAGTRAVAGHTGALAGSKQTWEAAFRQSGVIQVSSIEEMADVLLAFLRLRTPAGRRVGIVGVGGGASVQAADECEKAGLVVPLLPR